MTTRLPTTLLVLALWLPLGAGAQEAFPTRPISMVAPFPPGGVKELGYDIEFYIWAGVFAPKGTPEPVLKKLRDTVRQAVEEPEFKAAMTKLETPIAYLDAPEFQRFWDKDAKMLADAIKRVGKIEEKK